MLRIILVVFVAILATSAMAQERWSNIPVGNHDRNTEWVGCSVPGIVVRGNIKQTAHLVVYRPARSRIIRVSILIDDYYEIASDNELSDFSGEMTDEELQRVRNAVIVKILKPNGNEISYHMSMGWGQDIDAPVGISREQQNNVFVMGALEKKERMRFIEEMTSGFSTVKITIDGGHFSPPIVATFTGAGVEGVLRKFVDSTPSGK